MCTASVHASLHLLWLLPTGIDMQLPLDQYVHNTRHIMQHQYVVVLRAY